jgi:hypothetical protein
MNDIPFDSVVAKPPRPVAVARKQILDSESWLHKGKCGG